MLLGRSIEQARLAAMLDAARAGRSAALIVSGAPGVGKTSLLEQAVVDAPDFTIVRVHSMEAEAELPFAGLADLVRPVVELLGQIPGPQRAALSGALALGPPVPGDRFAVAAATLSLLAAAAERAPLVALIDDAHWLDRPSREALLFAARRVRREGVVLLLGMREREWTHSAGLDELGLLGLSPNDAAALVDRIGVPVAATVRDQVVAQTAGNPLAILETVAELTAAERTGTVPIAGPLAGGAGLQRAFMQRIGRLPAETCRALLIAATSETGAVAEITGALAAVGLDVTALAPAQRDGLIVIAENHVSFRHPLVRSAAYHLDRGLPQGAAHRALAGAIPDETDGRAAWHLAAATTGPSEQVMMKLEDAAETAFARTAYSVAASTYAAAARFTRDRNDRLRLMTEAGRARWLGGDAAAAASMLEGVLGLALEPTVRADLQGLRASMMLFTQPVAETYALLVGEAKRVAPHDRSRAATMLTNAAFASFMAAEITRAERTARDAVRMAGPEGGAVTMFAALAHGFALALRGEVEPALRLIEPALDAPELFGTVDEFTLSVAWVCQGFVWLEQWDAARWTYERIVSAARAAGAPTLLVFPLAALSELELRQGRIAPAYAAAAESVQLAADTGQIVEAAFSLVTLARVEAILGHEDECRAHVDAALAASRPTGAHSIENYASAALGLLELSLGHVGDAAGHLAECGRQEREHRVELPTAVLWAADLIEAQIRGGAIAEARRELDALEQRAASTSIHWARAAAARCRGILAAESDYEQEFAAALQFHGEHSGFERARTQLCMGMRRRRSRRRRDARAVLHEALSYFEAEGAEPWAQQTRSELRATGETPVTAANVSLSELTPQELQVAMSVAKGARNKEVAASLFLSARTVEFHLRNTYRKLGIRSRTELARRVEGLS